MVRVVGPHREAVQRGVVRVVAATAVARVVAERVTRETSDFIQFPVLQ